MKYITHSPEETMQLGIKVGKELARQSIVCFFGELAAGKTTFIKGLVAGAAEYPSNEVNSPTFVYLNIYQGKTNIYHFDLYRLNSPGEFTGMGFDEYLFAEGISCIEWSERIDALLPPDIVRVELKHGGGNTRQVTITYPEGNAHVRL